MEANPAAGAQAQAAGVCRTRLLADEPTGEKEDLKEDVPHRKLARSIADLMRHEPKGVSIGLEGSWGAGKTSVVRLLKQELKTKGELVEPGRPAWPDAERTFALVVFDAWAHEKDPLRRTFLETLITRLRAIGWVRPDVWKTRHDIIAQRLEKKSTESDPRLSKPGLIAAILFLFLTPIGGALFSDAVKTAQLTIDTSRPVAWRLIFGLLVMLLPALVIAVAYHRELWDVFARWVADPKGDAGWAARQLRRFEPAQRERSPSLWTMLFNKGVTAEQTRTFKTPNPTSIEFEAEFRRLMEEALCGHERADESETHDAPWEDSPPTESSSRRHLVLVFDNLDRVAASDALTIWSTLQTFLGRADERQPAWLERLWVIVLYDPEGLRLIWDKPKPNATGARAEGPPAPTAAPPPATETRPNGQSNVAAAVSTSSPAAAHAEPDVSPAVAPQAAATTTAVTVAPVAGAAAPAGAPQSTPDAHGVASTSFMDKSFQIRFEVPPPVFSDWRESLGRFLGDALEDHTPDEFDAVQTVFELYLAETGQEPTFRELKLFVNQIGALHRQWSSCCQPESEEKKFPLCSYAFYVLQRRRGVDVLGRLAEGTLIGDNYRELLGENPTATLAALAYNVPRAKAEQLVLEKPIENALLLGAEGAESLKALEARHEGFWDKLRLVIDPNRANAQHRRSPLWVSNAAQALLGSGIIDRGERHPLTRNVVRRLCWLAAKVEEWPAFDAKKAEALAALCRWKRELGVRLDEQNGDSSLEQNLLRSASASLTPDERKGDAESAREWLDNLSLVRREVEASQLPDLGWTQQINFILKPFAKDLMLDAGEQRSFGHPRLSLLLEALFLLNKDTPAAENFMRELLGKGHLLHHLWDKTARLEMPATVPAIVRCLWVCLYYEPNLLAPPSVGEAATGYSFLQDVLTEADSQIVNAFVELLDERGDLILLLYAQTVTTRSDLLRPFISQCLKQVVGHHERALRLFTPNLLLESWPDAYRLVNGDERPLTQGLRDLIRNEPNDELAQRIIDFVPRQNLSEEAQGEYGWLYAEAVGVPELLTAISEQVATWERALHEVDAERWRREILSWGGLYELVFALREQGRLSVVPGSLKEAIVEIAKQAASDTSLKFSKRGKERLPTELLDRSTDAEVFDRIYAVIADSAASLTDSFFDIFGRALADPSRLSAEGFERVLVPLLKSKGEAGLGWMKRVFFDNSALAKSETGQRVMMEIERLALEDAFVDELPEELLHLAVAVNVNLDVFRKYDVILREAGPRPDEVRAALSHFSFINPFISKHIGQLEPLIISNSVSFKRAHEVERLLGEAGGIVDLVVSKRPDEPVVSSEPSGPFQI